LVDASAEDNVLVVDAMQETPRAVLEANVASDVARVAGDALFTAQEGLDKARMAVTRTYGGQNMEKSHNQLADAMKIYVNANNAKNIADDAAKTASVIASETVALVNALMMKMKMKIANSNIQF
jgi:uncharacterized protein (DUF1800 family)